MSFADVNCTINFKLNAMQGGKYEIFVIVKKISVELSFRENITNPKFLKEYKKKMRR